MDTPSLIQILAVTLAGYFLGSFNGAQVLHHIFRGRFPEHVTQIGTKNAGTQNVWMSIGRRPAIFVLVIDVLKGYIAVWLAFFIGVAPPFSFLAGIAAVAGHNWPVYFHFNGGRGVATLIGSLFALDFGVALVANAISLFFVLIRWSGIMPFALVIISATTTFSEWGSFITILMFITALVILLRRLQVHWISLIASGRKLRTFKNIILYDRATPNPPSLREMFGSRNIGL